MFLSGTSFRDAGVMDNLRFLSGKGEQVDLLQGLDLHVFNQAVHLGDEDPLLIFGFTSTSPVISTTATVSSTTSAPTIAAKS